MFTLDPEIVALALGSARLATWEWSPLSDELRWTSGQTEIYSRPAAEIDSSAAWAELVHTEDRERVRLAAERALATETGFRELFRVKGRDGESLWIFGYAKVTRHSDQSLYMLGMNMDVTEWVETLAAAETRFIATFEQAAVGIAHVGIDGKWLNVNRRCCEIVGYSKNELRNLTFGDITHPDDLEVDWSLVRALLAGKRSTYSMEKRYFMKDQRLVWVNLTVSLVRNADKTPNYFIAVIEDITGRKQLEAERDQLIQSLEERVRERTAELEELSRTDALTGVANRRRLDEHLTLEWDRAVRTRQPLSMILIDIDYFKGLNDGLGHGPADRSLALVAKELTESARRAGDLTARYGGDEFILLLPETGPEGAMTVARHVQEAIHRLELPNPGSPVSAKLTVSQGVATAWPTNKGIWNSLMIAADRTLYRAKEAGRNRIAVEGSSKESIEGEASEGFRPVKR
jgi:diguanylate cyclase (GGDEF)-like protein/PAS domain S-box-containing protein